MKYFIQVTLTTYIAAILVYALWSYITFSGPDQGWVGSLVYLPHGPRVILYCFFGVRSLPALFLAETTGPALVYGDQYPDFWAIANIASLLSVVLAVEILKWSRVTNLIVDLFNTNMQISVNVVFRFFIGDITGAFVFLAYLMIMFQLLSKRKLYKVYKD
jgi:hypothetical protein